MKASDIPGKFNIPFANAAGGSYIRAIPQLSQIGITDGEASLTDGFPPLNFLAVGAGGVPPFGQDFNGLLKQITQWARWQSAGGPVPYDSSFQTAIGGYPQGAIVESAVAAGTFFISTADDNATNPDTGGAGWSPWPSTAAVVAAGGLGNVQQFSTSTRVAMVGNAGNAYTVTPWAPGNYTKQNATSKLIIWATFPTFTPGATGPGQATLSIGGQSSVFLPANNNSALVIGEGTVVQVVSGLGAGAQATSISFSRNDATAWGSSFCFNSTDNAIYPAATQATIVIGEIK